jgi:outer membrane lipase/esterase
MSVFRRRAVACAFLLLSAFGAGPVAAVPLGFGGIYAFGDSLTDNGNAYNLTRGLVPKGPPYWKGRFAEGPNWYDIVAAVFRAEGAETRNYAFGGAKAIGNYDLYPDLQNQRRLFQNAIKPKTNSLAAVWAGGNDVMARVGRSDVASVARKAADEVVRAVNSLLSNGVKSALVFNLGDLEDIPRYLNASSTTRASASSGTLAYNTRLASGLAGLRAKGMTIHEVDVFGFFKEVVANPRAFGIANLTKPCIVDDKAVCTAAEMAVSAFIDRIHPGAALHAHLAARVLDLLAPPVAVAALFDGMDGDAAGALRLAAVSAGAQAAGATPVPLPVPCALLLAGLGGLVLLRRRAA